MGPGWWVAQEGRACLPDLQDNDFRAKHEHASGKASLVHSPSLLSLLFLLLVLFPVAFPPSSRAVRRRQLPCLGRPVPVARHLPTRPPPVPQRPHLRGLTCRVPARPRADAVPGGAPAAVPRPAVLRSGTDRLPHLHYVSPRRCAFLLRDHPGQQPGDAGRTGGEGGGRGGGGVQSNSKSRKVNDR